MEQFERNGKRLLSPDVLAGLQAVISESVSVSDDSIVQAIHRCYKEYDYLVCPHTATAVSYFYDAVQK